jgi:hypothetical protein
MKPSAMLKISILLAVEAMIAPLPPAHACFVNRGFIVR